MNQAAGIVSAQANCSARDALVLLRERAAETDSDLEDAALAVVGRRISFSEN